MKIEIELHEGDFKYKGVEVWAYEGSGTYYRINKYHESFVDLLDAIKFIDRSIEALDENTN